MKWPKQGRCTIDDYTVYSGKDSNRHQKGVAIILSNEIEKSIMQCTPILDRIMVLKT